MENIESSLNSALKYNDENQIKEIFELIYNKYYKLVYFCISKYINDDETIKDLANECFLIFFENISKIKQSIKYYLTTIAKNVSKKYLKEYKKFTLVNDELIINYPDFSVHSSVIYCELIEDLKLVLTNEEVEIIMFHVVDGMTFKELGKKYGINPKAINKKYERAINKFKNSKRSVKYVR